MSRILTLKFLGAAAVAVSLTTGVLTLIFAVNPASAPRSSYLFPLVAAIVQVCSALVMAVFVFVQPRTPDSIGKRRKHLLLATLAIFVAVVATAAVGASLGWSQTSAAVDKIDLVSGIQASTFLAIDFGFWALSILVHLFYFFTLAWTLRSNPKVPDQRFSIDGPISTSQEMTEPSRPPTATTMQSDPFEERVASSPPSLVHSDGNSSLRSSFSTIQRPSSSKRGLILRQPSQVHRSGASLIDNEGFDSWDTSGVSLQIRETMLQTKPGLEPIPGSRSPSPAKALEGPFFQTSPSITPPASPLPQPSVSQPNSAPTSPLERPSDLPNFSPMFPPASPPPSSPLPATPRQYTFSRPGSRSGPVSRSGSMAMPRSRQGSRSRAPTEDHIHPLFRSSSPTPPPGASAGTNVTAAPEAGQFINERMLKRMRSGSLPTIPSPLVRSESSPDISGAVPPSPRLDFMPTLWTGSKLGRPHQRQRSSSFQGSTDG